MTFTTTDLLLTWRRTPHRVRPQPPVPPAGGFFVGRAQDRRHRPGRDRVGPPAPPTSTR